MPMRRQLLPHRPEPRRVDRAARRAWLVAGAALALAGSAAAAPVFDLGALMALLGQVRSGDATFIETRRVEILDRTLMSSGRLSFRAPDKFVRETLKPRHEKLAVDGNTLTMTLGERSRTMQLDASPEAAVIVEAVRGTLTGDRATLERLVEPTVSGTPERWTLELVPRDLRLRGQVQSVRITGHEATLREVQVLLGDGDRSLMTITPAPGTRTP
jgi:outer membrane lipoprotein-sorting protein